MVLLLYNLNHPDGLVKFTLHLVAAVCKLFKRGLCWLEKIHKLVTLVCVYRRKSHMQRQLSDTVPSSMPTSRTPGLPTTSSRLMRCWRLRATLQCTCCTRTLVSQASCGRVEKMSRSWPKRLILFWEPRRRYISALLNLNESLYHSIPTRFAVLRQFVNLASEKFTHKSMICHIAQTAGSTLSFGIHASVRWVLRMKIFVSSC